jgi:GTP cyclohydrolase II
MDANLALGRQIDERSYESAAAILDHLGGAQRRADDQHPG